jgi:hypothetical protein
VAFHHLKSGFGLAAVLFIAALPETTPTARAVLLNQTIFEFETTYTPIPTSNFLQINLANFSAASLNRSSSTLGVKTTAGAFIVLPVSSLLSSNGAQPGNVRFGGPITFRTNFKVTGTLVFNGLVSVKTSGAIWQDQSNNGTTAIGAVKLASKAPVFDPIYTVSNDLDPSIFSPDSTFQIENLSFLGNLTSAQFAAINIDDILNGTLPPGAVPGVPSNFTLESSQVTTDPSLFSQIFNDPFPEPAPDLWDVALGQLYDPSTGSLSAFIDAYQGLPEPSAGLLLASGIALLALLRITATSGA